jgi:hypothetical protein
MEGIGGRLSKIIAAVIELAARASEWCREQAVYEGMAERMNTSVPSGMTGVFA